MTVITGDFIYQGVIEEGLIRQGYDIEQGSN